MRKLYFLVPGTTSKYGGGGLWAELNTGKLAGEICEVEIVTYRQREQHQRYLSDILPVDPAEATFVVGWGFDVPKLISRLAGQNIIYHAHSSNYGFKLPASVPIIAVSRNTMGYWGAKAANNLIYYLPNQIGDEFSDRHLPRDIDVLVQTRKSSAYLLQQLVPALKARFKVVQLDSYVPDLAELFNRSKVYLYDSAEYWATSGVTEGFGLPPLEALACGCQVFSSVNHGLADFLDPGFNCHKIAGYSLEFDLQQIESAIGSFVPRELPWLETYRAPKLTARLNTILLEIDRFFDLKPQLTADILDLSPWRINWLRGKQAIAKLQRRLNRN